MASSLFHAGIGLLVLVTAASILSGSVVLAFVLSPIILLPVVFYAMGISWFLASLGVFLRDTSHTVAILLTALMFMSPIFYSLDALPDGIRTYLEFNPLATLIEQFRALVLRGDFPKLTEFFLMLLTSLVFAWGGLFWFMKTKRAVADVV